ncbi:flightin isoform X2 [Manduca sexta]|uniref:flightin isoform X2 n=1 Tax=Manduca sexta TaxID=7130 RepID=UPI001184170F|nr:flightin isoform X2 [Manduca sexta]
MWDDVEEETPEQPQAPAEEAAAPAEGGEAAPPAEGAPAEGEAKPEEAEPPPPENASNEPRRLVFKHWIRPKFLQYNYLYDYRKSYYDDQISYLDKRNKGLPVEIPRAQTWAERALRTYLANTPATYTAKTNNKDKVLLRHISIGARFQRYHTKSRISRITLA